MAQDAWQDPADEPELRGPMTNRCFVCAAAMLGPTQRSLAYPCGRRRAFAMACGSCGLLLDLGADPAQCRTDLASRLAGPAFLPDPDVAYGMDLYTLRAAATAFGLGVDPHDAAGHAELCRPHGAHAAQAHLYPLAAAAGRPVSLGVLCRVVELETMLHAIAEHAVWTDDVVVLLDAAVRPPQGVACSGFPPGTVKVGARPLNGDFAAQRNALQALARRSWMLQLDADETLPATTGRLLPALAALAEAGDVLSVGLPRRNRVDGILSDVYPDVQYRLNRSDVRYAGRVHERPALDGGWPRSFIALHGAIDHRLSRRHVMTRSRRYEALDPGCGRLDEEAGLLRPYRD